jgi:serine/threonine-protein kinase
MALSPGDLFADRYEVQVLLGAGGMGSVYRAHDRALGRDVALKVVRADAAPGGGSDERARMLREARAVALVQHPNVVALFDVGEADDTTYLAMELVDGAALRSRIGDASVPFERRVAWLRGIAEALVAAHDKGIVHRDLKPENVMTTADDGVKVLDFGIAKQLAGAIDASAPTEIGAAGAATLTATGTIIGTPAYMAPEQLRAAAIDARADQFAWGVLAYELLTGELPWGQAREVFQVIAAILAGDAPSPRAKAPEVPAAVDAVVRRALAVRAEDRFASMADVLAALDGGPEVVDAMAPTLVATAAAPAAAPARKRRGVAIAALGVALLAAGAGAIALRGPGAPPPSSSSAPAASAEAKGKGVGILDLPLPKTSPEALAAYVEGLRAMRSATAEVAIRSLSRAVELDPSLAEGHLRLALLRGSFGGDQQSSLARALQERSRLTPRDQAVLRVAQAAAGRDPSDIARADAAHEALSAEYANDAEIAAHTAMWKLRLNDLARAEKLTRRAMEIDPGYGEALTVLQLILVTTGRFDEAHGLAERCMAEWPSTDCAYNDAVARAYVGDVEGTRRAAEAGLLVDPATRNLALYQASALLASGASLATARAALDAARAAIEPHMAKSRIDAPLAAVAGDLDGAIQLLRDAYKDTPRSRTARSVVAVQLVHLLRETGRDDEALRFAEEFRATLPSLQAPDWTATDQALTVLHELVDAGKLGRDEYARLRDAEVARATAIAPNAQNPGTWATVVGAPVSTADEAKEALVQMARLGEPRVTGFPGGVVGRLELLAGDVDGALPDLERSAREVRLLFEPWAMVRAKLLLGQAREAKGDTERACAAYGEVVALWGRATPRSRMADEAKRRRAALRCPAR